MHPKFRGESALALATFTSSNCCLNGLETKDNLTSGQMVTTHEMAIQMHLQAQTHSHPNPHPHPHPHQNPHTQTHTHTRSSSRRHPRTPHLIVTSSPRLFSLTG